MNKIAPVRKIRCAIYTRKSSEEGLDMEFNSLDAQREACESFIASQKTEGWILVPDRFDDGGFSGGNIERPGLKRLLADIEAGKVDCIVTYKIDRLTRSLADFAKLVETFDRAKVTFVSVTQQFNTTTSMGRLTLNILLSFAQFEREVTAERIRDKFLASRRKGMWMGGVPPLGYDVQDRHLVVNETEAALVRRIFERFLELGSAIAVIRELAADGAITKSWTTEDGTFRHGKPFNKGTLYKLVNNRTYLGEAVHKGTSYPGEHAAIVDRPLWDKVHAVMADNARRKGTRVTAGTPAPLKGLIRCGACGGAMTPSHTRRHGRLYRYYLCSKASKNGHTTCPVRAVAADEAETLVFAQVRRALRSPEVVACTLAATEEVDDFHPGEATLMDSLRRIDTLWEELFPAEQARILHLLIDRIEVTTGGFDVRLRGGGLRTLAAEVAQDAVALEG
ncbi:MAG: recombinase family protein [Alphaproteobacteria bacterium]|nr:recombinase family protein [Alphaproteobacteria bacterium]